MLWGSLLARDIFLKHPLAASIHPLFLDSMADMYFIIIETRVPCNLNAYMKLKHHHTSFASDVDARSAHQHGAFASGVDSRFVGQEASKVLVKNMFCNSEVIKTVKVAAEPLTAFACFTGDARLAYSVVHLLDFHRAFEAHTLGRATAWGTAGSWCVV